MQAKTFNRIVLSLMLVATVIPGLVYFVDLLTPQSGFLSHIIGYFALLAIPILWVIGNLVTFIFFLADKKLASRIFWLQCVCSVIIIICALYLGEKSHQKSDEFDLRRNVSDAILSKDLNAYKKALELCGKACFADKEAMLDSVTSNKFLYDLSAYKDWVATAVAVQAPEIVDALLKDSQRPEVDLIGLNSPFIPLNHSCRGYYVGDANVFEIAVLQKTSTMLNHLLKYATQDDKNAALWYAVRANRLDDTELLIAAGADRSIKDEYGIDHTGSLMDAAISGFAMETLQWLLSNGFDANGPLGEKETLQQKHTPLHSLIYAAHQEQEQFGSVEQTMKMWDMLIKNGANPEIGEPNEYHSPSTPLQKLLDFNVYEGSAAIVKAFVAHGIPTQSLTTKERAKLDEFLNTNTDKKSEGQLDAQFCAEQELHDMYEAKVLTKNY